MADVRPGDINPFQFAFCYFQLKPAAEVVIMQCMYAGVSDKHERKSFCFILAAK